MDAFEHEYDFVHLKGVHLYSVMSPGKMILPCDTGISITNRKSQVTFDDLDDFSKQTRKAIIWTDL